MDYRGRGKSDWSGAESYTLVQEGADVMALLDHLQLDRVAVLGTSRGGLIAMGLAATAKDRLTGVCLNDIGPVLESAGLETIKDYIGRNPKARTFEDAAAIRASLVDGFANVPQSRWEEEARIHYIETPDGLIINYDPALRDAVLAGMEQPAIDLWPFFDALQGLPLALIRGANSQLLSKATADEMARRRPDMTYVNVPDRGHVPFLDEPESLAALHEWIAKLS